MRRCIGRALDSTALRRGCGDVPITRAAVMRSEPLEVLEFAPALPEANVFFSNPFLSRRIAAVHRRHGERHLADDIRCRFLGLNKSIDAGDQHQLSPIFCLSLNRNCCKRQSRCSVAGANATRPRAGLIISLFATMAPTVLSTVF